MDFCRRCCLSYAFVLSLVNYACAQPPAATAAVPAVPRLIRFAGSFHAPSGQPAGPLGATFSIYSQQEGGTPLWTEEQNVEVDANGNYSVLLGATTNEGVPVELFSSNQARWLQVQFHTPGAADLPRVLLVSVPYALKAGDAETLGGKPASAYVLAPTPPSAASEGSSGAAQPAASPGSASARSAPAATPAHISGLPNYISRFTTDNGLVQSILYQNGNNVGTGTTQAAIPLDVRSSSSLTQMGVAGTTDYLSAFASDSSGPGFYWDPAKDLRLGVGGAGLYNMSSFVELMRLQSGTGNVGIGTASPAARLEVNGNAQVDGNLTLTGSLLSPLNATPVIQAPANGTSNFGAGLGALSPLATGAQNTAVGDLALNTDTTGASNTALGAGALQGNTTGAFNTALGAGALVTNTTSPNNTAVGYNALFNNAGSTGGNTAVGFSTLTANTTGASNTAVGASALQNNSSAAYNTALGAGALLSNTTSPNNTAVGYNALFNNAGSTGGNTAVGFSAMDANTTGASNTALGAGALQNNTTAAYNTAVGAGALFNNTASPFNTAVGYNALFSNTTSVGDNTAVGFSALSANTTGAANVALGFATLKSNTVGNRNTTVGLGGQNSTVTGSDNTALGYQSLSRNTSGNYNTAIGEQALFSTTGSNNLALGYFAGWNVTSGNNNVDIANQGATSDSGVIRIGTPGSQTSVFLAGVRGVTTGNNNAVPLMIDSNGQLGTVSSSRRFKEDIHDMGSASSGLLRLRPVTFRYKRPFRDGSKPVQYGLIAEEVAKVYPDLVARSADGQIETVKYQVLDTMLLNELQKENATIKAQKKEIRSLEQRLARVEAIIEGMPATAADVKTR
jgi:trimeric autotransporter adhesin